MKLVKLLCGDIYFQYKYGFYFLYVFFTLIYIALLHFLPSAWKSIASALIVLSDPVMIGLVFVGALVLFEKSERVLHSILVSPISLHQYILSKIISMALISLLSGLLVAGIGAKMASWPTLIAGLLLGSILFSLAGLILAGKVTTLNGFVIGIAPIMLFATIPAVFYLIGYTHWTMQLFPGVSILNLILDREGLGLLSVVVLGLWISGVYVLTFNSLQKMMKSLGGMTL